MKVGEDRKWERKESWERKDSGERKESGKRVEMRKRNFEVSLDIKIWLPKTTKQVNSRIFLILNASIKPVTPRITLSKDHHSKLKTFVKLA